MHKIEKFELKSCLGPLMEFYNGNAYYLLKKNIKFRMDI